jgi:sec-independent protein translocase protein TatC
MPRPKNPQKVMPVLEHIRELRSCILVSLVALAAGFVVAFVFSDAMIGLVTRQFARVSSSVDNKLVVHSIVEGFVTQMKIAVIGGLTLSMPVHIFNALRFAFPGLTRRQRRIILAVLSVSLVLIVFGAYVGYFLIVPTALYFLTNPYFLPPDVGYILNYQTNVFYVLSFILWSLLAMQTPLVLEVLLMMGVLKRKKVFKASRFIIVLIFIFAAMVTPSPDFISQLGIAIPLVALYFFALLVAKIFRFGEE